MTEKTAPTKRSLPLKKKAPDAALRAQGTKGLTPVRRIALQALDQAARPLKAYALLELINKDRAKPLSAMSLYRALDWLVARGIALRVDRTSSYAVCRAKGDCQSHLLLVCDSCGAIEEAHDKGAFSALNKLAAAHGHLLAEHAVEIHGQCKGCGRSKKKEKAEASSLSP